MSGLWCEYATYRAQWLQQFGRQAETIRAACEEIVSAKKFSLANDLSDSELQALTRTQWFHERVFDKYLWWNAAD